MAVRESQVEDVLATYPHIARRVLGLSEEVRVIARQMTVDSGRIDLLLSAGARLALIELKVVAGSTEHLRQVAGYRHDLTVLQESGRLVRAPLECFLLCPDFTMGVEEEAHRMGFLPVRYSVADVMTAFFAELRTLSQIVAMRPADHGIWNIHLINRTLLALPDHTTLTDVARAIKLSARTVSNHLRFASELKLVMRQGRWFVLTELGGEYNARATTGGNVAHLSDSQAECLRGLIVHNPFASPTVFGIYALVDSVFTLARNGYPVPREVLQPFFRDTSGKRLEWTSNTTAYHGIEMYSNYAVDLGLLAVVGHDYYLTPDGLRSVLLLQLHKSLQMVEVIQK